MPVDLPLYFQEKRIPSVTNNLDHFFHLIQYYLRCQLSGLGVLGRTLFRTKQLALNFGNLQLMKFLGKAYNMYILRS